MHGSLRISGPLSLLAPLLVVACTATPPKESTAPPKRSGPETMASEEVAVRRADLASVMQSKVAYSAALLSAIALHDYPQLERNAEELRVLSLEASFIVHDTVTYRAMSESFRAEVTSLAAHARERNQAAIEEDYRRLTDTCFRCHAYVREERFRGSLPGRVSMR